jgi:hypothetical protein
MSHTRAQSGVVLGPRPHRRIPRDVAVVLASLLTLSPPCAVAQTSSTGWQAMHPRRLATLYVRDHAGLETTGQFLRIDATSLVVLVDGREQRFDAAQVACVSARGDRVRNGLWKGAVVGAGLGLLADCYHDGRPCGTRRRVSLVALAVGVWSGIGVGVDALHSARTVLYEARTPAPTPSALESAKPSPADRR